jgi:hypothetical protein
MAVGLPVRWKSKKQKAKRKQQECQIIASLAEQSLNTQMENP